MNTGTVLFFSTERAWRKPGRVSRNVCCYVPQDPLFCGLVVLLKLQSQVISKPLSFTSAQIGRGCPSNLTLRRPCTFHVAKADIQLEDTMQTSPNTRKHSLRAGPPAWVRVWGQTEHVPYSLRRRERNHVLEKKTEVVTRSPSPAVFIPSLSPPGWQPVLYRPLSSAAPDGVSHNAEPNDAEMLNQTSPGCCSSWLALPLHWVPSPAVPSITPGVGFIFRTTCVAGDALTCCELIFWYLAGRIYTRQQGLNAPCMWKIMNIPSHDPKPWFWSFFQDRKSVV